MEIKITADALDGEGGRPNVMQIETANAERLALDAGAFARCLQGAGRGPALGRVMGARREFRCLRTVLLANALLQNVMLQNVDLSLRWSRRLMD